MATVGSASLLVALALALYATLAAPFAGLRRDRRLTASASNAVIASFGATLVAAAALLIALARHDFSIGIVADTTSRSLPIGYVLSAFWAGLGLVAIVVGLVRDVRELRYGGLALLGLGVAKLFLYDLAELNEIYRVLSFVAVGLLLLTGAYAYQRVRSTERDT